MSTMAGGMVILSTMGDIMMHVERYYEYCRGVQYHGGNLHYRHSMDRLGTVWSIIHVWDLPLKQLPSQQQIHWHYVRLRMGPI